MWKQENSRLAISPIHTLEQKKLLRTQKIEHTTSYRAVGFSSFSLVSQVGRSRSSYFVTWKFPAYGAVEELLLKTLVSVATSPTTFNNRDHHITTTCTHSSEDAEHNREQGQREEGESILERWESTRNGGKNKGEADGTVNT